MVYIYMYCRIKDDPNNKPIGGPKCACVFTCYLQVCVELPVGEEGFGELPQEGLEQRGYVVGVEAPRAQVHIRPAVQQLPQRLLTHAVARHPE